MYGRAERLAGAAWGTTPVSDLMGSLPTPRSGVLRVAICDVRQWVDGNFHATLPSRPSDTPRQYDTPRQWHGGSRPHTRPWHGGNGPHAKRWHGVCSPHITQCGMAWGHLPIGQSPQGGGMIPARRGPPSPRNTKAKRPPTLCGKPLNTAVGG